LYAGHAVDKESYFWHARNQFEVPGLRPERAFISLIAGAYEHRSWYRRYLDNLGVPKHLENVVDGIFDGKSVGPERTGLDEPLVLTKTWSIRPDFAIDGLYLKPSRTVSLDGGGNMPLTEALEKILASVDGTRSVHQVIAHAAGSGDAERVTKTIHEAIAYGVIAKRGAVDLTAAMAGE
jgi:hypothetical protein